MTRDKQIAKLIRLAIAKVEDDIIRFGYDPMSPNGHYLRGSINGLRCALSFVDPKPQPSAVNKEATVTECARCIVCHKPFDNIDEDGNQPSGGVEFTTGGHYGSTVFDPMDGSIIAINVCDGCLAEEMGAGNVLAIIPAEPASRPRARYEIWRR
jgi:hypothetical protein